MRLLQSNNPILKPPLILLKQLLYLEGLNGNERVKVHLGACILHPVSDSHWKPFSIEAVVRIVLLHVQIVKLVSIVDNEYSIYHLVSL